MYSNAWDVIQFNDRQVKRVGKAAKCNITHLERRNIVENESATKCIQFS